jgi:recombination protein RecT
MSNTQMTRRPSAEIETRQPDLVGELFAAHEADIRTALADRVSVDQFRLGVVRALQKSPDLRRAEPASLVGAIMDCARLGLIPAGYDAQAAIITRAGQAALMVMVGGLVDLARREGVVDICAETVRENEPMSYDPHAGSVSHTISMPRSGKVVAAYAWAVLANGRRTGVEVVTAAEIAAARAAGSGGGAWKTWDAEMAKKVAKRRLIRAHRLLSPAAGLHLTTVEGDDDAPDEETQSPTAAAVRAEVMAKAPAALPAPEARPVEGATMADVARGIDALAAAEDARVTRLQAAAASPAVTAVGQSLGATVRSVGPDTTDMRAVVTRLRAEYAQLVRTESETAAAAMARATEALGPVAARNYVDWRREAEAAIAALRADREQGAEPGADG